MPAQSRGLYPESKARAARPNTHQEWQSLRSQPELAAPNAIDWPRARPGPPVLSRERFRAPVAGSPHSRRQSAKRNRPQQVRGREDVDIRRRRTPVTIWRKFVGPCSNPDSVAPDRWQWYPALHWLVSGLNPISTAPDMKTL